METPTTLNDRYEVTSHIARGGMADVYQGQDTLLNRTIAVKVLHSQFSQDEAFVKRFRREAQSAANLSHPNVVAIYDWGQALGTYYIVMELVDGRSLRDVLKSEGALLPRRATEIAAETAAALSVAHQAGVIHRDIKPGNILLAKDGTVKVTDFGIARAWDDSQELTRTGAVIGTATYFSPEQAQGANADARSDVYALGVVLFEVLTGRPPFVGDSPMAVAFQHVSTEALAPSSLNPDVPPELDAIVAKAMRKDPDARYQSAEEMRQDLLTVLAGDELVIAPAAVAAEPSNDATRVITSQTPPPTVPPDEVYRQIEDEPSSQIPFIITASALLLGLGLLLFFLFRGGTTETETVLVPEVVGMSQELAIQRLNVNGLLWDVSAETNDEFDPGIVLRSDPEEGTEVDSGSTVILYVSSGPQEVEVPAVVGLQLEVAKREIEAAGLAVGEISERPDPEYPAGVVIVQSPVDGQWVAREFPINLTVSEGPETAVMPNVVGDTEREAVATLGALGIFVGADNVEEEHSDSISAGTVMETRPPAGTEVVVGDSVVLVVSLGSAPVSVPNLSGMTENEADNALRSVGLVISVSNTRQPVDNPNDDNRVVSQSVTAGQEVGRGTTVTVTLGDYQPPPTTTTTTSTTTTTVPETTTTTAEDEDEDEDD